MDRDAVSAPQLLGEQLQPIETPRDEDQVEAGARQPSRESFADSRRGAGDQRCAAVTSMKIEWIVDPRSSLPGHLARR
jgi:hypothetical protein